MTVSKVEKPIKLNERQQVPDQVILAVISCNLLEVFDHLKSLTVNVLDKESRYCNNYEEDFDGDLSLVVLLNLVVTKEKHGVVLFETGEILFIGMEVNVVSEGSEEGVENSGVNADAHDSHLPHVKPI